MGGLRAAGSPSGTAGRGRDHRTPRRPDHRCAGIGWGWRDYWLAMDARGTRPPRVAGVAATYEAETTLVARGLGISFTTSATARFYDRPGITYVPIVGRPPSQTALAWLPGSLSPQADALVRHVRQEWGTIKGLAPHDDDRRD